MLNLSDALAGVVLLAFVGAMLVEVVTAADGADRRSDLRQRASAALESVQVDPLFGDCAGGRLFDLSVSPPPDVANELIAPEACTPPTAAVPAGAALAGGWQWALAEPGGPVLLRWADFYDVDCASTDPPRPARIAEAAWRLSGAGPSDPATEDTSGGSGWLRLAETVHGPPPSPDTQGWLALSAPSGFQDGDFRAWHWAPVDGSALVSGAVAVQSRIWGGCEVVVADPGCVTPYGPPTGWYVINPGPPDRSTVPPNPAMTCPPS